MKPIRHHLPIALGCKFRNRHSSWW
jgi:hypothetical protein